MCWLLLPHLLGLAGCLGAAAPETDSDPAVDSDDTDVQPVDTDDPCAGVPVVDWDNFGHGFVLASCQGCHASTAPDRHDAPEGVTFDTRAQVWARADDILRVATGEAPSMPPRGGVDEDDRTRLVWWLACGVPGR